MLTTADGTLADRLTALQTDGVGKTAGFVSRFREHS